MSGYLLDTHVVVWLATVPSRVPESIRANLENAQRLCVSATSAYEIAQKVRLGKIPECAGILARWEELLETMMADELSLTAADMAHAGTMAWAHRDPFDRMLVAQSQRSGLILVTKDAAIRSFPAVNCAVWE